MVGQRGTALLMTMILITVIGSIAFGVGRTTLSNLRQVNRLEDSLNAYQAAQAGIEDALLRFRFDKNAEAPVVGSCTPSNVAPTTSSKIFSRVDISNPEQNTCFNLSGPITVPSNPADIVYDLKMYYKKDPALSSKPAQHECITVLNLVGQEQNNGCVKISQSAALSRDTATEYDVSSTKGTLSISATFATPITSNTALEVIPLNDKGDVISSNQKLITASDIQVDGTLPAITLSTGASKIRFRPFGNDILKYDIYSSDPSDSLDSRITTVESIGYFGVSKRKLTLTLDRLTGTVSEVFDFVLFSGSGPIIGPGN